METEKEKDEESLTLTNKQIESILAAYPDVVADALKEYKTAEETVRMKGAELYLIFKAEDEKGKMKDTEIKNKVIDDESYHFARMKAIEAEAKYMRVYETLMCAKKMAGIRTAY